MVYFVGLCLIWSGVWPESIRLHRCDVIELNTVVDADDVPKLRQYIFWSITARGTWYVRDWRTVTPGMPVPRRTSAGAVELIFSDARAYRQVRAKTYFETRTYVDRELENRKFLPVRLRRPFF